MIQDIAPYQYDNSFAHRRDPRPEDYVFFHRNEREMVIIREEESCRFPTVAEVGADDLYFAFLIDEIAFFVGADRGTRLPEGIDYEFLDQNLFRTMKPQQLAFAGITGMQLIRWLNLNHFCGCCGTPMEESSWERAFVCPRCGKTVYPRLNPAVIVGVIHGDKILVTAYANRQSRGLALIAGFTEIGESVEDTVRREVFEEVGIRVKNLRYYKSQPWSFSDSLLLGFFCELEGDAEDVVLDEAELKEARWLRREELPDRRGEPALTAEMMQYFKDGKI